MLHVVYLALVISQHMQGGIYSLPDILEGSHLMTQSTWNSMYPFGAYLWLEVHCKQVIVIVVGKET